MPRRKRPREPLDSHYMREWREHRGLSQEEVGKVIGLDKSALSKMERFITPYDQIHLQMLSRLYKATIPDLLGTDPRHQTKPNSWGTVGFRQIPKVSKRAPTNPAARTLLDLLPEIVLPEEVDAVKVLVEALISRRTPRPKADEQ